MTLELPKDLDGYCDDIARILEEIKEDCLFNPKDQQILRRILGNELIRAREAKEARSHVG